MTESGPGGEEWPADVDKEGSGIVYWISSIKLKDFSFDQNDLVSAADYEEFLAETMGSANKLDIPFQPLTTENIAAIAAPGVQAVS